MCIQNEPSNSGVDKKKEKGERRISGPGFNRAFKKVEKDDHHNHSNCNPYCQKRRWEITPHTLVPVMWHQFPQKTLALRRFRHTP